MALKGFSEVKTSSYGDKERDKFPVLVVKEHDGSPITVRPVGPIQPLAQHWVERRTNKGTVSSFPAPCANYNPKTDEFEDNGCPWCAKDIRLSRRYYTNVIDRDAVENEPKKIPEHTKTEKKGREVEGFDFEVKFKDPDSKSWTPVKVLSIPAGVARDLGAIEKTKNSKTSKKSGKTMVFPCGHEKYGFDITVLYEASRKSKAWSIEFAESTPLEDEEKDYLYHDLTKSVWMKPVDVEEQIAEFKKIKDIIIYPEEDEEDNKPSKKSSKKSKSRDEDLDDDEDDLDIDEDDEDEAPRKKSKKAPAKKSKKEVEYDDEDLDDDLDDDDSDEDDDEEDEAPRKKSKKAASKKKAHAKKSKSRDYDEDDEDDEDDDSEEDDDDLDF